MMYNLTDDLLTGNKAVDAEHKELIKIANELMDACNCGAGRQKINETVDFLVSYINKHFDNEELLWMKSGCDGIDSHKEFHKNYKMKMIEVANELKSSGANIKTLADVNVQIAAIISHIRIMDKKMASQIKQNKVGV